MKRTPNFVSSHLREARKSEQLTQEELAEKADLTRQTIGNYEKGETTPSGAILKRLAAVLGFPARFFVQRGNVHDQESSTIFWRSQTSAAKRAKEQHAPKLRWMMEFVDYLSRYVELPEFELPSVLTDDPMTLEEEDIEEVANDTREKWGLGKGPISNVMWLLENRGFITTRFRFKSAKLDGFSTLSNFDGRPYLVLNEDKKSAARSRFDAIHEAGHIILHSGLSQRDFNSPNLHHEFEKQAHRFASAFLFPRESFIEEVGAPTLNHFRSLKRRWKVSIQMMIQRAHQLGMIDDQDRKSLFTNMSRRGWKQEEPLDDEIKADEPNLLSGAVRMIVENGVAPRKEILEAVPIGFNRLEKLANLPENYLAQEDGQGTVVQLKTEGSSKNESDVAHGENKVLDFPG